MTKTRSACLVLCPFEYRPLCCRDICPILKDPAALAAIIDLFEEHVRENHQHVDLIAGNTHWKLVGF